MRILHLSDGSLPDWRIEKSATTAIKAGHQVIFAGGSSTNYVPRSFSKTYEIQWLGKRRHGFLYTGLPPYWRSVKMQLECIIKEVKPDIIHAHNIFPAKLVSEFRVPFVYDNHEYWSVYVRRLAEAAMTTQNNQQRLKGGVARKFGRKLLRRLVWYRTIQLWTKWEKELVSNYPTITVSDTIAEELRAIGNNNKNIFVVPNYPMALEVKDFEKPKFHDKLSSVYAGVEAKGAVVPSHRNIDGLVETFRSNDIGKLSIIGATGNSDRIICYRGFLPRQDMFREMFNHSIGLVPFKNHWSHVYISPNKAYEYAHAGLVVLSTPGFVPIKEILGKHCITFEDYEDMASKLKYFKENLDELYKRRLRLFDYARENLIWEKTESSIIEAYRKCV